jgi:serine/threonine-protein kinase ULK/ATG1
MEEEFLVKIGDLGFSKIMNDINDLSNTYCGTPINMAPEILNKHMYNYKADVWSLGTMIFELLTG